MVPMVRGNVECDLFGEYVELLQKTLETQVMACQLLLFSLQRLKYSGVVILILSVFMVYGLLFV